MLATKSRPCLTEGPTSATAAAAASHCSLQVLRCGKWQRFRQGEVLYDLSDGEPMRLHLLYKVCLGHDLQTLTAGVTHSHVLCQKMVGLGR